VECIARYLGQGAHGPVYDCAQLEPSQINDPAIQDANRCALDRAVQYLDLRGKLHRPVAGYPQVVCFFSNT
jgi:hypothetical protein